ncbi:hypothetical protein KOI35_35870 [Actinoplanes bogorensis]|uniref:ABC transporter permease n=1 Tax=Paractinoplanes bogorensis TaxID=1610840 RepID=A0ABS5YZN0_9ACTN|nr:hypothetical protein [Actinoplanes bogorensis]MBU2668902.1 hypothetical protein [Actinoplanes bogorensis]
MLIAYAAHRAAAGDDPIRTALRWTQAGFLVLGALAVTHEYEAGGQIRATLLAVPRRGRVLSGKGVAVFAAALIAAAPIVVAAAMAGGDLGTTAGTSVPGTSLDPGRLASLTAYLVGVTLIAAATGTLVRNSLSAVAVLLTAFLVVAPLVRAGRPQTGPWLPDTLLLAPSTGGVALAVWTSAAAALASIAFSRRNP